MVLLVTTLYGANGTFGKLFSSTIEFVAAPAYQLRMVELPIHSKGRNPDVNLGLLFDVVHWRPHMTRFMTRVQLNGRPSNEQYEVLHKEMKLRGFTRIIASAERKLYWLPHGTYYREANCSFNQVLVEANQAASKASTDHEIVVSETSVSTWQNLKPATQADAAAA